MKIIHTILGDIRQAIIGFLVTLLLGGGAITTFIILNKMTLFYIIASVTGILLLLFGIAIIIDNIREKKKMKKDIQDLRLDIALVRINLLAHNGHDIASKPSDTPAQRQKLQSLGLSNDEIIFFFGHTLQNGQIFFENSKPKFEITN